MESSIAVFLLRQLACELLPTSVSAPSNVASVTVGVEAKKGGVARVLPGRGHCIPF